MRRTQMGTGRKGHRRGSQDKGFKKAQMLQERGYIVLPTPAIRKVIKAFEMGAFKEFERHSRVGMVTEESFAKTIEGLRKAGAK